MEPHASAIALILDDVRRWPGVTLEPHRFGGTAFRFGRGELGHVHTDGVLDIGFPRPVRDQLIAARRAEPHHALPDSGWVTFLVRGTEDVPQALALLRLAFESREHARARREPVAEAGGDRAPASDDASELAPSAEDLLDEAIEESFPASDSPAVGGHD
jgi:hypothetical protein